jgi:nuclear autoantigenic sperm protein
MADKPEEKIELTVEEKSLKAKELYGKGCRNYYVKNYTEAADDLSDACELYGELFGLQGDELGEVYLLYAKALIAVEQAENKLMDIQEEEEDDETDDDVEESAENDSEEKAKDPVDNSKDPEEKSDQMDVEEKPKDPEVDSKDAETDLKNSKTVKGDVITNGVEKDESKDPESQAETSDEKNPEEPTETEEDGGNLEVAWEVLQNAAQIFERQNEKGLSNLLDVYNEMAGISIENENFAVALEDYARALASFDRIEESQKNYRIAAEIHYKIGLCQTLEKSYDDSIKSFQKAHDLLSDVIEKEKSKEQTDEVAANIKDMEETKQEILNKINETGDVKADEVEKVLKELAKFYSKMNTDNSKEQSSESASDISHLVKRKKPDIVGDSNIESSPAKKQVIETEEAIKAVPVDDEKKKIEEEEAVQPVIDN